MDHTYLSHKDHVYLIFSQKHLFLVAKIPFTVCRGRQGQSGVSCKGVSCCQMGHIRWVRTSGVRVKHRTESPLKRSWQEHAAVCEEQSSSVLNLIPFNILTTTCVMGQSFVETTKWRGAVIHWRAGLPFRGTSADLGSGPAEISRGC